MGLINFIKSKTFFLNLFLALVVVFLLGWAGIKYLNIYTLHGETVTVPDLTGYSTQEVEKLLEDKKLGFEIIDSLYSLTNSKGSVLDQDPKPNQKVKENRTIYLTVNTILPPKVKMPNLVDLTLRQATSSLEIYGLKIGTIRYVPDIAKNAVVDQEVKGKKIEAGTLIAKGSIIDLVLGQGEGNEVVQVPNLLNMTVSEVSSRLNESFLNVNIIPDKTVKDTSLARVYKQIPPFNSPEGIKVGNAVDVFVTQDYGKIVNDNVSN